MPSTHVQIQTRSTKPRCPTFDLTHFWCKFINGADCSNTQYVANAKNGTNKKWQTKIKGKEKRL